MPPGLGEKAKSFIHSIDTMDSTRGHIHGGTGPGVTPTVWDWQLYTYPEFRRQKSYSDPSTQTSDIVPKDRVWVVINWMCQNANRTCKAAASLGNTRHPGTDKVHYFPHEQSNGAGCYVDMLKGMKFPLIMTWGDYLSGVDVAYQVGDGNFWRLSYFELEVES